MTEMKDKPTAESSEELAAAITEITIVEYNEELAASMAEMFNGWDDLWPGGYTQGVPYTEERVKKQFNAMSSLAVFLAIDEDTKKTVGMCTLHPHWLDSEAAYVGTLGVSPEALNKKVGKRLLLRAIAFARSKGRTRVDLNTWAGNMRAVPLYKKVGLMWNPQGDGLRMEDYVPEIVEHTLSQPFFEGLESDAWYDLHVREIVQGPDDFEEEGMAVYPYRFENGEDSLSVVVDRHSRAITSIERTVHGETLKVNARVKQHLTICGVPSEYTLELSNSTSNAVKVNANLVGFEGLHFDSAVKLQVKLKPGESKIWQVPFYLDSSAPIHRSDYKTPAITTELNVDGIDSILKTGLIIRSAAEIRTRWGDCRIAPSGKSTLPITIINGSVENMAGTLHFDVPENLTITPSTGEITIPSTGLGGIVVEVTATDELTHGTHDLWAYLKVHLNGSDVEVTTRKFRIPIYCLGNGHVAIGEDDRQRRVKIVSSHFSATFAREGGALRVANRDGENSFRLGSQIGPPFGINAFRWAERDVEVDYDDSSTTVTMKATHPERPLVVEVRGIFEHSNGVVRHEVLVTNTSDKAHSLQVRIDGTGGISLAPGRIFIPMKSGVIEEHVGNALFTYPSLPGSPDAYSEGWIAVKGKYGMRGQFWDLAELAEVRLSMNQLGSLHYPEVSVEAGETKRLSRVWIVTKASDWRDVQRMWKERVANVHEAIDIDVPTTRRMIELESKPVVIPHAQESTVELNAYKAIVAPLPADLVITPPEGWSTKITASSADEPKDNNLSNYVIQDGETIALSMTPESDVSDGFAVHKGDCSVTLGTVSKHPFTIIQLGTKQAKVDVMESEDQGSKIFKVSNGHTEFVVSPDYGGCMTSLKNERGTELLISAFPTATPKPGGFLDNYYGGVQPIVWDDAMSEDLMKAQTSKEKMTGRVCEIGIWKGVEIEWIGAVQQLSRGINFRLQYLTTPGSPVVIVRWIIKNPTSAPVRFIPSLFLDPAFDGKLEGYKLITEWEGEMAEIQPAKFPLSVMSSKNFIWLNNGDSENADEGLVLLTGGTIPGILGLSISSYLLTGTMNLETLILPGKEKVITSCLHVDPSNVSDMVALQESLEDLVAE